MAQTKQAKIQPSTKGQLTVKYRPTAFADVIGQDAVVASLEKVVTRGDAQTFLMAGPSGCGKTTLARIAARVAGAEDKDIVEIDAATRTGVDDMRAIQEIARYKPFGGGKRRAIIIDECHRLSLQAWESLLKITEEPPPWVMWFFCTTNPDKVPKTIKTRCASYALKLVGERDLDALLGDVCKAEGIDLSDDVLDLIIAEANGSPRQLLANLEICRDVETKKQAAELLKSAMSSDATRELCQFLLRPGSWQKAMAIVKKMESESPEGVRIVVQNYMAAVAKNAKSDRDATNALTIMAAFSQPYNTSENFAPLLLSIGDVVFRS